MEFIIPALALGGLYKVSQQQKQHQENFESGYRAKYEQLPNHDIPNRNYPDEYPVMDSEADQTSKLSKLNVFDEPSVYTDKYFNPAMNRPVVQSALSAAETTPGKTYTSMTGQSVDIDYFRHNNMAPFFGSKSHANNAPNALESTLDKYTGSGSQHISKKEQSPLFSPDESYQWAYGMPSTVDFVQSRMNPSMNMANVTPFEQIKVGPGLGLGFTAEGVGGYNSGMFAREQWIDKNVDELRVASKQKASGLGLYGFEGPAVSSIQNPTNASQIGIFEKNGVDKTFEMGQDRLFTTTGVKKGETLRSVPIKKNVSRPSTSTEYAGVAGSSQSANVVRGEYMPSHNQQLDSFPLQPAYALNYGGANEADFGAKSTVAYPNNRSIPRDDTYYGAVKNTLGAAVAPFFDILKPSRKENAVGTMRPYQNPKSNVESSYFFNPNDTAPVTIRQTTENSKFHMNVNANQHGGAYQVTPQQPAANERDTTTDFFYAGNASAREGSQQPRAYDAEYRQRNNDIKSSTILGRMVPGNMALLNNQVQMTQRPQEKMLLNTRPVDGKYFTQTPSVQSMGALQGNGQFDLYQGAQLDRNNGDILSQLKANPYTLNVVNGL